MILRSLILSLCLLSSVAFAQSRVPASMTSVDTNGWKTFMPATNHLQSVLTAMDSAISSFTNDPAGNSNSLVSMFTAADSVVAGNFVSADTSLSNSMVTAAQGQSNNLKAISVTYITSTYANLYSTNILATNLVPVFIGQMLNMSNPQTNIIWVATNLSSTANWKSVARTPPSSP